MASKDFRLLQIDWPGLVSEHQERVPPERGGLVPKIEIEDFSFRHKKAGPKDEDAVKRVNLTLFEKRILSIIGPSGCGKSTLIRAINRMFEEDGPGHLTRGEIRMDSENLLGPGIDLNLLRTRIGILAQKPAVFLKTSIYDNVALGVSVIDRLKGTALDERVEMALRQAAVWDEVKDVLDTDASKLSGGQQQRVCLARTVAMRPEVILLDEATSSLDPISTAKIEQALAELSENHAIVIITHNLQQAARASDFTVFMLRGEVIECSPTKKVFVENAQSELTQMYVTGRGIELEQKLRKMPVTPSAIGPQPRGGIFSRQFAR